MLILVPARGGSKGLPGKNLRLVAGESLVHHAIAVARKWCASAALPAHILVDTDCPAIARAARLAGGDVPFLREAAYAADETSTVASTLRFLDRLAERGDRPSDLMLLQPTSPLRSPADLTACWQAYLASGHSSVSVTALGRAVQQLLHLDRDGCIRWAVSAPASSRRQDADAAWFPNGAVYCIAAEALRADRAFVVEGRTVGVPMPPWRAVDIDAESDLEFADQLARLSLDRPQEHA